MSNKKSEIKFNFKNQLIDYQSNLKGFDEKIFNEFNKKSEDLNLFEKIKELKDGKKVNPVNYFYSDLTPEEFDEILKISSQENQSLD